MFEESVEGFVVQWKPYAARVELFARTEGSPLLECRVNNVIFSVFDRTGPYDAPPGEAQLIINPVTEYVAKTEERRKDIEVVSASRIRARGLVLVRQGRMVVVDAGAPLVVGVFEGLDDDVSLGGWLEFESLAPIHGFVVPVKNRAAAPVMSSGGADSI